VSTHACVPVAQENVPWTHSLGFSVQVPPSAHAEQTPALQTWSGPQFVPFAICVVVSSQVSTPVSHEVTPSRQAFGL
jgi:hypothetical protein